MVAETVMIYESGGKIPFNLFSPPPLSPSLSPPYTASQVWMEEKKKMGGFTSGELAKLNVIMLLYHCHIWPRGDWPDTVCGIRGNMRRAVVGSMRAMTTRPGHQSLTNKAQRFVVS